MSNDGSDIVEVDGEQHEVQFRSVDPAAIGKEEFLVIDVSNIGDPRRQQQVAKMYRNKFDSMDTTILFKTEEIQFSKLEVKEQ